MLKYASVSVAITLICFVPSLFSEFTNLDDQYYVLNNIDIRGLSFTNLKTLFTNFYVGNYQPISMLTYAFEYKIMGLNPFIYHFTNLILHLSNTLLVFLFIRKLSSNLIVAFITSVLFGIHPLHVESVSWISERKDVLYTFFYLLGLITYLNYYETKSKKYYFITMLLFSFSCMSKAMAVPFTMVLIIIDYYKEKKFRFNFLIDKIPFFIISLVFGLIAIYVQKSQGASGFMNVVSGLYSTLDKIALANYSMFFYVYKMFIPYGLSVIHPYPNKTADTLPIIYYLSPLFNLTMFIFLIYSLKRNFKFVFGFLFFFFNVAQILQILPVGSAIVADRYFYVSSIGLFYIVSDYTYSYFEKPKYKNWVFASIIIVFSTLGFITYNRNRIWKNSETLWTDMIKTYPKNELPYYNRGVYLLDNKKSDAALIDFTKAAAINPNSYEAFYASATIYQQKGDLQNAINCFSKALVIKPQELEVYVKRGDLYRDVQQYKLAEDDFNKAISINPDYYVSYMSLGIVNSITGKMKDAIEHFDKAQKLSPNSPDVYSNRGNYYAMTNNIEMAIADYSKAIELDKNSVNAYLNRGTMMHNNKKYNLALEDFNKLLSFNPNNYNALFKISMTYKEMGDKENALQYALKAKSLGLNMEDNYLESLK